MTSGMSRQNEQIIGFVFLGLMIVSLLLAVTTFDGTPTVLLLVSALVFLVVGLFLLTGGQERPAPASSQQQSVILSDGQTLVQGGIQAVCASCGKRVPESARFCPGCGHAMGA